MKPYYEDGTVTIFHGDCMEVLPELEAQADLLLTDPPFFMPATHYQSRMGWRRTWGDTSILANFWKQFLKEALPRVRRTGHVITFCDDESYPVFYPVMYVAFDYLKSIVWDKTHVGLGRVWRSQHELMIAARWKTSEFADETTLRSDVLKYKATPSSSRLHPVEKPVGLLEDLIGPTTKVGGVVLDPFMGSGTTLRAAKDLGRKAIGIDNDEGYCEGAASLVSQGALSF